MRSKIINISSLLLLLSVVGCSENTTTTNSGLELSQKEILFSIDPDSPLATKGAVVTSFSQLETVGIYAFSDGGVQIKNASVSWAGEYWSFSPSQYWEEGATSLDFFAYSPYSETKVLASGYTINDNEDSLTDEENQNMVLIDYEMPIDIADHEDLLIAVQTATSQDEDVKLFFKHPMANICLKIDDSQQANIIDKPFVLKGISDQGTVMITAEGFAWVAEGISSYEGGYSIGYISAPSTVDKDLVSDNNYAMVVPQEIPEDMELSTTLSDGTVLTTQITGSWEEGKVYTYVVSITEDKLMGSSGEYSDYTILVSDVTIADAWSVQQAETAEDYNPSQGANFNVGVEDSDDWGSDDNAVNAVDIVD